MAFSYMLSCLGNASTVHYQYLACLHTCGVLSCIHHVVNGYNRCGVGVYVNSRMWSGSLLEPGVVSLLMYIVPTVIKVTVFAVR